MDHGSIPCSRTRQTLEFFGLFSFLLPLNLLVSPLIAKRIPCSGEIRQRGSKQIMSIPVAVLTRVVLALLAGVSAFFSGMETALFSINGFQVRRWREREPEIAEQFEKLMVNSSSVLSVILLTDTLVNIPLIIIALVFVNAIPAPVPNWVKTLVIFGLIVLVCDLLPKVLALADPFRFSKSALRILKVLMPIAEPFSRSLQQIADRTADLFAKE